MPTKVGIQNLLKILDSPVSSTGQAHRRTSLARNDETVIATQPLCGIVRLLLQSSLRSILASLTTTALRDSSTIAAIFASLDFSKSH
jgi:hypothetical protein